MRIAICDDEIHICEALRSRVLSIFPAADISVFTSGEALLADKKPADILLLDIEMPGLSGMETARRLRENGSDAVLIFVTGKEEYVFDAFDVDAFQYLVKPISDEKLAEVLRRATRRLTEAEREDADAVSRSLTVKRGGLTTKVRFSDILYAEVFGRIVMLHTEKGDVEYYGSLTDLAELAGTDFFRTHRAYLVNLKRVERYNASEIFFAKGTALLTKKNYPAFVRAFMESSLR